MAHSPIDASHCPGAFGLGDRRETYPTPGYMVHDIKYRYLMNMVHAHIDDPFVRFSGCRNSTSRYYQYPWAEKFAVRVTTTSCSLTSARMNNRTANIPAPPEKHRDISIRTYTLYRISSRPCQVMAIQHIPVVTRAMYIVFKRQRLWRSGCSKDPQD